MKLLVVEDEQAIAKNPAEYLRGNGFAVDLAFDGNTGWEKIRKTKYDLILLDWMLPGMDGLQILAMTRREFPDRSILMLTAKDTLDDKVSGLNVGADDYIVKPFQLKEVLARVQAILRREIGRRANAIDPPAFSGLLGIFHFSALGPGGAEIGTAHDRSVS